MSRKGYQNLRPLGVISVEDDNCWYFYFRVPEGVVELEVYLDLDTGRYVRKVSAFITDSDHVRHLLQS